MQVILGIVVGIILTFIYISFFGIKEDLELIDENKELKELRKQAVHNNTIILERNRILENTIKEIETENKKQQFGSVTNLQNKINHILMTVKSK